VNPLPASIAGTAEVCIGFTSTLTNTTAGGTWTSSNTAVATIGATSGIMTGISAGTATISYTLSTGCSTSTVITTNPLPATITGPSSVCAGSTITLSATTTGGSWSSSNTVIATAGAGTGVITGVSAGAVVISYTLPTGCVRTTSVTVNPLPSAGTISGTAVVCVGATTSLSSTVGGGTWSTTTGNTTISTSGLATGVSAGIDTIKYTVVTVCGTATVSYPVTVNPLPVAGSITGSGNVCLGLTTTLTAGTTGGSWSSSNTTIATVGTGGVVTGVALGTASISYTVTNSCGSATATTIVTVNPLANAGSISGADTVCQIDTIHLSSSIIGGTWSSTNPGIATVTATGIVAGVTPGTATIRYIVTNVCSADTATKVVVVKPSSACVTGTEQVTVKTTGFRLYPNPARDVITIETAVAGTLTVFSIDGRIVGQYHIMQPASTIKLNNEVAEGVYMCRFNGNDGAVATVRLIYQP
jgi:uncharacterized protein YjdB